MPRRGEWDRLWESAARQGAGAETLAKYAGFRVRSVLKEESSWEKPVPGDGERWAQSAGYIKKARAGVLWRTCLARAAVGQSTNIYILAVQAV